MELISYQSIIDFLKEGSINPKHPFHWPALSTVATNSSPQSRIVVLRNFENDTCTVFTDLRSRKCQEITNNNRVSLLFFNSNTMSQIRAKGIAKIISDGAYLARLWDEMSSRKHGDYQTLGAPGQPFSAQKASQQTHLEKTHFGVIEIQNFEYDYLKITRSGHLRQRVFLKNNEWCVERLIP